MATYKAGRVTIKIEEDLIDDENNKDTSAAKKLEEDEEMPCWWIAMLYKLFFGC